MKPEEKKNSEVKDAGKYPGVATDVADDEKVDAKAVKEEVKELNNNPRNNDI